MKKTKLLIILILVFTMSGCNSENIVENSQLPAEVINTTQEYTEIIETSTTIQENINTSQEEFIEIIETAHNCMDDDAIITHREEDENIIYQEGIYDFRMWTKNEREYHNDLTSSEMICIPDKESAIIIASGIYKALDNPDENIAFNVFFDTKEEIWIVSFRRPELDLPSTVTRIALRKDTAEVLITWTEPG